MTIMQENCGAKTNHTDRHSCKDREIKVVPQLTTHSPSTAINRR